MILNYYMTRSDLIPRPLVHSLPANLNFKIFLRKYIIILADKPEMRTPIQVRCNNLHQNPLNPDRTLTFIVADKNERILEGKANWGHPLKDRDLTNLMIYITIAGSDRRLRISEFYLTLEIQESDIDDPIGPPREILI